MSDDRFSEENQRSYTRYKPLKIQSYPSFKSSKAEGTPALAELLFQCMHKGDYDSAAFKVSRKRYSKLNDEQIWQAYELWLSGKVSESLLT